MNISGFRTYLLAHRGEEGNDVVLDLHLDLIDPVNIEIRPLLDYCKSIIGDASQFVPRFAGSYLHIQPYPEPVLRFPYGCHFGSGIAGDHGNAP